MSISIKKIANMSRINLTPMQEIQSHEKLEEMILYINIINSVDKKLSQDFDLNIYKNRNIFRKDISFNLDTKVNSTIKKNAPEFLENLFVVPLLVKREK